MAESGRKRYCFTFSGRNNFFEKVIFIMKINKYQGANSKNINFDQ